MHGSTSTIIYNISANTVSKQIVKYSQYTVYDREIYWLKYLNAKNYAWCPRLVSHDAAKQIIVMEYRGVPINKHNAPKDWKQQLTQILNDLQVENILHNDIKCTELLVYNNKLSLIDYGWASKGTDWSCGGLFSSKHKPHHKYPDHNVMQRLSKVLVGT